ncbi:hypothetical protein K458DRAFT_393283 [Lentithecium fluviatile CBS 122367]|uniref:Uncharacterized protein n=1 Tax=Lentithecium fluviatile CBS 122367 TaxID=1168545 RepID=A0A6G1IPI3_9PLEO|nr:hypothetical protein K458DRAFT_393283 [Lentithecium fluviatile CBS 122367]
MSDNTKSQTPAYITKPRPAQAPTPAKVEIKIFVAKATDADELASLKNAARHYYESIPITAIGKPSIEAKFLPYVIRESRLWVATLVNSDSSEGAIIGFIIIFTPLAEWAPERSSTSPHWSLIQGVVGGGGKDHFLSVKVLLGAGIVGKGGDARQVDRRP